MEHEVPHRLEGQGLRNDLEGPAAQGLDHGLHHSDEPEGEANDEQQIDVSLADRAVDDQLHLQGRDKGQDLQQGGQSGDLDEGRHQPVRPCPQSEQAPRLHAWEALAIDVGGHFENNEVRQVGQGDLGPARQRIVQHRTRSADSRKDRKAPFRQLDDCRNLDATQPPCRSSHLSEGEATSQDYTQSLLPIDFGQAVFLPLGTDVVPSAVEARDHRYAGEYRIRSAVRPHQRQTPPQHEFKAALFRHARL